MSPLLQHYDAKVKTVAELASIVGPFPREKKLIMCHGVFDVVHPGHVRHLLYAKSRGGILVASVTADKYIAKGTHRPHVPQDLRAMNLAAYEAVDYVLIDSNPTPIETIKKLQPDFFAKGFEYVTNGMTARTVDEALILDSYGGEILFTPGDIVYSSSSLIDLSPPNIGIEKLTMLMNVENITFGSLHEALDRLGDFSVHVVGDTIVDSYTNTALIGGQTKTPTMSVRYEGRTDYIGGAAIVAKHMGATGAEVHFSTVLGEDPFKNFVLRSLEETGVRCHAIIDPNRPTTQKNSVVAGGYHLLKIDTLDNSSVSDRIVESLVKSIQSITTDSVAFCDFRHGIFNRRTIPSLIDAIPDGVFRVADSQVASRWGNITEFKGFDLITPNEREARFALGDQDSGIRPLASSVHDAAQCKTLILKLGDRGVLTSRTGDHVPPDSFFVLDSFADHVEDAIGAGDALLAYATLSMLATGSEVVATIIGSMAAACECELSGNIPITINDVRAKLKAVEVRADLF